jgi:ATP-dependent helicase/nuclease subunit A
MVTAGLGSSEHLARAHHPHYHGEIFVWQTGTKPTPVPKEELAASKAFEALPVKFSKPLPPVPLVPRPLSPSGASLIIEPETLPSGASPVVSAAGSEPNDAILRGQITHKLLESLPVLPQETWQVSAERYVGRAAPEWPQARQLRVVAEVMAVLGDPRFAPAFAEGSRAEVSVMGHVNVRGETRLVSGKIDRIAVEDERVILLDFKTDYAPPKDAADVPNSYLTQMALYRAIVQPLYPAKKVECALLYTGSANLIPLLPKRMDEALEALANS